MCVEVSVSVCGGETHRIHVLWDMASVSVEALRVWRRMAWEGVEGHQVQHHCIIHYQEK